MNIHSFASGASACIAPVGPGIGLAFELASGSKKKKKTNKKKKSPRKPPDPPKERPPNPQPNWRGKT